jgi:moderate conductance mechanosensitive channel
MIGSGASIVAQTAWWSPVVDRLGDAFVGPALRASAILVVAAVVSRLATRSIRRGVERAREPGRGPVGGLRRRLSLTEGDVPTVSHRRTQRAEALGSLAASTARVAVWVIAVLVALGTFGVEVGPLVAGAGIVGVALGFGAQDVVKDVLAGVFMLLEDQYGVGDVIDAGDAVGVVESVSLRSTRIRDLRGTLWHVPNGAIRRVGNLTQGWSRAVLDVSVAYEADLDRVMQVLAAAGAAMAADPDAGAALLDAPEVVGVEALGADGVVVRMTVRTSPGEQWAVTRDLRRRVKSALEGAGIEIPYPQRTVRVRHEDTFGSDAGPQA